MNMNKNEIANIHWPKVQGISGLWDSHKESSGGIDV